MHGRACRSDTTNREAGHHLAHRWTRSRQQPQQLCSVFTLDMKDVPSDGNGGTGRDGRQQIEVLGLHGLSHLFTTMGSTMYRDANACRNQEITIGRHHTALPGLWGKSGMVLRQENMFVRA